MSNNMRQRHDEKFIYEFNLAAGPALYQESVNDIKALAPGYCLTAQEWATVWRFADKYDIAEFPEYTGDIYKQRRASLELIKQITAADEYIESNAIDKAAASRLLN